MFVANAAVDGRSEKLLSTAPEAIARLMQLTDNIGLRLVLSLPGYMVPSAFVPLPRMLYAISNKVDRRKLRSLILELDRNEFSKLIASWED